jgi:chemotaxis protein CheX
MADLKPGATLDPEAAAATIRAATAEVFSTMLGLEPTPGDYCLAREAPGPIDGVVALIGLAGQWAGTGMLTCSASLACTLSACLLAGEPGVGKQAVDDEVLDSMAEITNMVLGNVKNQLEECLGSMGLSIPTVIYGRNFTARSLGEGDWVVVPFACGGDRLEVRLRLVNEQKPHLIRHGFPPQAVRV